MPKLISRWVVSAILASWGLGACLPTLSRWLPHLGRQSFSPTAPETAQPLTPHPVTPIGVTLVPPATATSTPELKKALRIAWSGGDTPVFDPVHAWDWFSIQLIESTTIGLMRVDERSGALENALATAVEISQDGLTYTFHLQQEVPWVIYDPASGVVVRVLDCNGEPRRVTAHDFEYGLLRLLRTPSVAGHGAFLAQFIAGALPYARRQTLSADEVGIKALDESHLELRFTPSSYARLGMAALWLVRPAAQWHLEGEDCDEDGEPPSPSVYPAYGAYVLKRWQPGASLTLVKNPFWEGIPQARLEEIEWVVLPAGAKIAALNSGRVNLVPLQPGELPHLRQKPPPTARLTPLAHLPVSEFYLFNTRVSPTDDRRVRQALSLAIDRDALAADIANGSVAARGFLPPALLRVERAPLFDPQRARELLKAYLQESALSADRLALTLVVPFGETHRRRAERVQTMWQQELGITVQLASRALPQYDNGLQAGQEAIYSAAWSTVYPDAGIFLWQTFGVNGAFSAHAGWLDLSADVRRGVADDENTPYLNAIFQAASLASSTERERLYAQAETVLVAEEALLAPLVWYRAEALASPRLQIVPSRLAYERFELWDILE